jgi:predicted DNA-binding transcriptional regulator YafY
MGKKHAKKHYSGTQPQLARLHGLVQRIQKGDYPSQKILAAEWGINPRTIQRDMDFIRDFWRLPLEYDLYRYGYYFAEPVGRFPMVPISEGELVSVFVAEKALRQYHGTPFEQPLKSAFQKLVSSLKGEISVAWSALDSAISFRGIETDPGDAETFQKLSGAIRTRHEIEFEYRKLEIGGQKSEGGGQKAEVRRVRPYHLACIGNQWYLFGYDLLRRDIRKFVPTRMRGLRVRDTRFERPRDFSVDRLLKGSFGVFSGGELVEMRIWFDAFAAQLVKERRWHQSQEIRELGNGEIEYRVKLSSLVEIVPWILGWGIHARALSPRSLVAQVRSVVKELGRIYAASRANGR